MNNLYEQLADLIKQEALDHAKYIYSMYGRKASRIYPSYHHVLTDIAVTLEASLNIPEEVIESIIEAEGLTAKLGAIALYSHVKDDE